jgi:hypothetical protein
MQTPSPDDQTVADGPPDVHSSYRQTSPGRAPRPDDLADRRARLLWYVPATARPECRRGWVSRWPVAGGAPRMICRACGAATCSWWICAGYRRDATAEDQPATAAPGSLPVAGVDVPGRVATRRAESALRILSPLHERRYPVARITLTAPRSVAAWTTGGDGAERLQSLRPAAWEAIRQGLIAVGAIRATDRIGGLDVLHPAGSTDGQYHPHVHVILPRLALAGGHARLIDMTDPALRREITAAWRRQLRELTGCDVRVSGLGVAIRAEPLTAAGLRAVLSRELRPWPAWGRLTLSPRWSGIMAPSQCGATHRAAGVVRREVEPPVDVAPAAAVEEVPFGGLPPERQAAIVASWDRSAVGRVSTAALGRQLAAGLPVDRTLHQPIPGQPAPTITLAERVEYAHRGRGCRCAACGHTRWDADDWHRRRDRAEQRARWDRLTQSPGAEQWWTSIIHRFAAGYTGRQEAA